MRVLVTGATGLIGRALVDRLLARGDSVVAAGRDDARVRRQLPGAESLAWDPLSGPIPSTGAEAVIHLAGEPVADRRWSAEQKRRIRESRVGGTRNLVEGLRASDPRPTTLVAGSAIGYYGDRGDELLTEASPPGEDFLARLVVDWEAEARRAEELGIRVALARTGIVLSPAGGALPKLAMPFRLFAGGPLGSGRQWMSWIHLDDQVGLLLHALDSTSMSGPFNLVAPSAVRNRVFAATLGRVLGRPALMPAPRFALELALGERVEVLLASQRVQPSVGYAFAYPDLEPALRQLLR